MSRGWFVKGVGRWEWEGKRFGRGKKIKLLLSCRTEFERMDKIVENNLSGWIFSTEDRAGSCISMLHFSSHSSRGVFFWKVVKKYSYWFFLWNKILILILFMQKYQWLKNAKYCCCAYILEMHCWWFNKWPFYSKFLSSSQVLWIFVQALCCNQVQVASTSHDHRGKLSG